MLSLRKFPMTSLEIKLEQPLFYNSPFGLRFEIGPAELGVWLNLDQEILNEDYFNLALQRAVSILESAFLPTDNIAIVLQIFSYKRQKIHKRNYLFRQIQNIGTRTVKFTSHRDLYVEDLEYKRDCWKRVTISGLQLQCVNYKNILHSIINQDFAGREPRMKGQIFLLNLDQKLVLHLYDDRGMDVVAQTKKPLELLYERHKEWILAWNRKQIDEMFSESISGTPT